MERLSKVARRAHFILDKMDVKWKIGDELRKPTEKEVEVVLDSLWTYVYNEEDNTEAEIGGLRLSRRDGHCDVFIYLGEIEDESYN